MRCSGAWQVVGQQLTAAVGEKDAAPSETLGRGALHGGAGGGGGGATWLTDDVKVAESGAGVDSSTSRSLMPYISLHCGAAAFCSAALFRQRQMCWSVSLSLARSVGLPRMDRRESAVPPQDVEKLQLTVAGAERRPNNQVCKTDQTDNDRHTRRHLASSVCMVQLDIILADSACMRGLVGGFVSPSAYT